MTDSNQNTNLPDDQNNGGAPTPQNQPIPMMERPAEDLLAIISKSDVTDSEEVTEKQSLYSKMMQTGIQIRLFVTTLAKRYPAAFKILGIAWTTAAVSIICCGLITLGILGYIYFTFPYYVRVYLAQNNIISDELDRSKFSFSNVEIKNVKDKRGTYEIKSIILKYTIADLLNRKINSVTLDGVRVMVKESEEGFDFGALPGILLKLNQGGRRAPIQISSLGLRNATIDISGQKFHLPISFSMTGVYEGIANVNVPLFIKEDYINLAGNLTVKGKGSDLEWTMDVTSGVLTFPGQSPENVTGKMTINTVAGNPSSIVGELGLSYGQNSKTFNLNLTRGRDDLFSGEFRSNLSEVAQYNKSQSVNSIVSVRFEGLNLKNGFHHIESIKPIQVSVQTFQKGDLSFHSANTRLLGNLVCKNFMCDYRLTAPSTVNVGQAMFAYGNNPIKVDQGLSFVLLPLKEGSVLQFKEGKITYDFILQRLRFMGYKTTKSHLVNFTSGLISAKGFLNMGNTKKSMALEMEEVEYGVPDFDIKSATFKVDDAFIAQPYIQASIGSFSLKDATIVKKPFKVVMEEKAGLVRSDLFFERGRIMGSFEGGINYNTQEMQGEIYIRPFDVASIGAPMSTVSSLFSPEFKDATGEIGALGMINWKNSRQVSGPLYVLFRNVGFTAWDNKVSGLNAVITFASLDPLVTLGTQKLAINHVDGTLPLKNIVTTIQMDQQFLYLTAFNGYLGNVELSGDSALIPYRAPATTIFLRNNNVPLHTVAPYLSIPMTLSGKATVTLPVEVREGSLQVKTGEIKLSNGRISEQNAGTPVLKDLLDKMTYYDFRSGVLTLNSIAGTEQTEIQVVLDERTPASQSKKTFRRTYKENLNELVSGMESFPIPGDVVEKQHLFSW